MLGLALLPVIVLLAQLPPIVIFDRLRRSESRLSVPRLSESPMPYKEEKLVWRLSELQEEPVHWLWPGRIAAGKTTLIDGDPDLGKSLLTLDLAARLTTARPLPDGYVPPEPVSVILVGRQDGLRDTVLPRLKAAEADLGRVHFFAGRARDGVPCGWPSFPDDCDLLRETVEETGARLIVLDPLMDFVSERACSLNDHMVRKALGPLAQLAEETRAAMQWVRHLTKGGHGQGALYRGSGSIAIIGAARTAFLVGRSPEDDNLRVLACTKNNLAERPPSLGFRIGLTNQGLPIVAWTGPVDVSADDLVLRPRLPYGEALAEAKHFLQELLETGPCAWEEVQRRASEAGISVATLKRAKGGLRVLSKLKRTGDDHQWYWSLPAAAADSTLEPWGEQRAEALKAAREESRRFFQELCERQKSVVRNP